MFNKFKSKKLLKKQQSRFEELYAIVKKYEQLPEEYGPLLIALLNFFEEMSAFQDKGSFDTGQSCKMEKYFPSKSEAILALNRHLINAGRDEYGMNRTKKGERVISENVYLGGVFGLNTYPVSFWYSRPSEPEIETQVKTFVNSHVKGILEHLNILLD